MRRWILPLAVVAAIIVLAVVTRSVLDAANENWVLKTPTSEQLQKAFPGDSRQVLESSRQFILYSLHPRPEPRSRGKELFHEYPVLGKTAVADAEDRAKLLAAFYDGMARVEEGAACFSPRHGIRAVRNGESVDVVICFECQNFMVYVEGKKKSSGLITGAPQAVFDQVLSEAAIPVAQGNP